MKSQLIFFIIILLFLSGCQSIKRNDNFAIIITPVMLPISPEKGEIAVGVMSDELNLYDLLKNKKIEMEIMSNDPFIYKVPDQTGLLEELAKILKTLRSIINVNNMNLANANTTKTQDGKPYRMKGFIINEDFEIEKMVGVPGSFKKIYDPDHPDSDNDGYLYLPNVNEMGEKLQILNMTELYNDIRKIIEKINKNCVVSGLSDNGVVTY